MDGLMVVLVRWRNLVLGVYGGVWTRLKDLGGKGVGPVLQRDLYINTALNVRVKRNLHTKNRVPFSKLSWVDKSAYLADPTHMD